MDKAVKILFTIIAFIILILGLFYSQKNRLVNIGTKHGAKPVVPGARVHQ